jgi:hypothetical protein
MEIAEPKSPQVQQQLRDLERAEASWPIKTDTFR